MEAKTLCERGIHLASAGRAFCDNTANRKAKVARVTTRSDWVELQGILSLRVK